MIRLWTCNIRWEWAFGIDHSKRIIFNYLKKVPPLRKYDYRVQYRLRRRLYRLARHLLGNRRAFCRRILAMLQVAKVSAQFPIADQLTALNGDTHQYRTRSLPDIHTHHNPPPPPPNRSRKTPVLRLPRQDGNHA